MAGKHRARRHKHRAYDPRLRNTASAVGVAATIGTAAVLSSQSAHADPGVNWDAIAACESGGNWGINTGNGFLGGLQWTQATWRANGGIGSPANAGREQQIAVANRLIATQGVARGLANWPVCGKRAGSTTHVSVQVAGPKHAAPTQSGPPMGANGAPKLSAPSAPLARTASQDVPQPAAPREASHSVAVINYIVRDGDTLTQIADAQHVAGGWQQVAAANPALVNPDEIQIGQHLLLPASAEPPNPAQGHLRLEAFTGTVEGSAPIEKPMLTVKAEGTSGGVAARAVAAALSFRGTPYVMGGNSPGKALDCSALAQLAYRAAGVPLPRVAAAQATIGKAVKLSDVRAGDLLFYYAPISHVAVAVDSAHVVEASRPGQPVAVRALYTNGLSVIKRIA